MKEVHQSTHDTILAEYEAEKAKKEATKATMIQKAWTYKNSNLKFKIKFSLLLSSPGVTPHLHNNTPALEFPLSPLSRLHLLPSPHHANLD